MDIKLDKDEVWAEGLSDCCGAPVKEVGSVLTVLICSECENMCNIRTDEDDFPDDFFDDD